MASNSAWRGACSSGPDFMSDPPRPRTEVHCRWSKRKTNTRRWLNKCRPDPLARTRRHPSIVTGSNDHYQVVPVDNFIIRDGSECLANLFGPQARNLGCVRRGIIRQTACEFDPIWIAQGDDVPFAEVANYLDDADRQETLALVLHGVARPGIDNQPSPGAGGVAQPPLPGRDSAAVRQEKRPHRLAREEGVENARAAAIGGDDRP